MYDISSKQPPGNISRSIHVQVTKVILSRRTFHCAELGPELRFGADTGAIGLQRDPANLDGLTWATLAVIICRWFIPPKDGS